MLCKHTSKHIHDQALKRGTHRLSHIQAHRHTGTHTPHTYTHTYTNTHTPVPRSKGILAWPGLASARCWRRDSCSLSSWRRSWSASA